MSATANDIRKAARARELGRMSRASLERVRLAALQAIGSRATTAELISDILEAEGYGR